MKARCGLALTVPSVRRRPAKSRLGGGALARSALRHCRDLKEVALMGWQEAERGQMGMTVRCEWAERGAGSGRRGGGSVGRQAITNGWEDVWKGRQGEEERAAIRCTTQH